MEPLVGEISIFAGNFAPFGWEFCNGQLLSTADYNALFFLIGTTYGGDGQNTFALPDLRGRVPIHIGTDSVSNKSYLLGQYGGTETVTITVGELPAHNHQYTNATKSYTLAQGSASGTLTSPSNAYPAIMPGNKWYGKTKSATATDLTGNLIAGNSTVEGGSQPHTNLQPSLCVNFIICLLGVYPSRP